MEEDHDDIDEVEVFYEMAQAIKGLEYLMFKCSVLVPDDKVQYESIKERRDRNLNNFIEDCKKYGLNPEQFGITLVTVN